MSQQTLVRLSKSLFNDAAEARAFVDALQEPQRAPSAVVWLGARPADPPFSLADRIPWQPPFVDRVNIGEAPGHTALHLEGAYYCLDFSSVFSATPFLSNSPTGGVVVDLCASPGGKAILAKRGLSPSIVLANETIGKRTRQLISNLTRCNLQDTLVTSADSSHLADLLPHTADLVIADAPCSGQSLAAKGISALGAFHPTTINMNSNRQRRIIANASRLCAPGGKLAYITCTYSRKENEGVLEWFIKRFPWFRPLSIEALGPYRSHLSPLPCYRLWPQQGLGAGGFTALLENTADSPRAELDITQLNIIWPRPAPSL